MHVMHMASNVRNVMVPTSSNTIETWHGAAKPTPRLTHLGSKQRKETHALTTLNVPTAKGNIKLIATNALSGSTDLIDNGTQRRHRSSEKSELIQFTQLWAATNHVN